MQVEEVLHDPTDGRPLGCSGLLLISISGTDHLQDACLSCRWCPYCVSAVQVDGVHGMEEEAAGASDLLAALAQLTSLRSLELYEIDLQAIEVLQRAIRHAEMAGDPEMGLMNFMNNNYLDQFSALTASSKLEKLVLAYRDEHVQRVPLPRHVDLEQIFRPGEQLLHLTELSIDALDLNALADLAEDSDEYDDSDSDSDNSGDEMERRRRHDPYSDHWCICCMDFKLIANCCPNLQCLTLNSVLAHEELQDITVDYPRALRKLQRHLDLKYLCLGGPWLSTASAAAVATMTSLECLELYNAPMLRANALEQLTALRQLEKLEAQGVCCDRQVDFCLVSTVRGCGISLLLLSIGLVGGGALCVAWHQLTKLCVQTHQLGTSTHAQPWLAGSCTVLAQQDERLAFSTW